MARLGAVAGGLLAMLLAIPERGSAEDDAAKTFRIYERTQELGLELYSEFVKKNLATLRTVSILRACSKAGLAKAVEAKIVDRKFTDGIDKAIEAGKFVDLPIQAVFSTQSYANAMVAGYLAGYQEAVALSADKQKQIICEAAVGRANKILDKP